MLLQNIDGAAFQKLNSMTSRAPLSYCYHRENQFGRGRDTA